MAIDATVRARVDPNLKSEAESIFRELGLTTSQAIVLFLKKVKTEKRIPFELKTPNEATLKAMREAQNMDGEIVDAKEFIG